VPSGHLAAADLAWRRPPAGRTRRLQQLCWPNSASCRLAGHARMPRPEARSGTGCESIRPPDRGGKRGGEGLRNGRGRGLGGEGQVGEGVNNLVSWKHVRLRAFCYMHGPQEASACARTQLHQHTQRTQPACTHSCAGMSSEPRLHALRATRART
jgi:hypothetical protein